MKFKPGERVRIKARVSATKDSKAVLGREAIIVKLDGTYQGETDYCVRPVGWHKDVWVAESGLQKLLPDSDTYIKSTWADFHEVLPKQLERVT